VKMTKLFFIGFLTLLGAALAHARNVPGSNEGKGQEIIGPIDWECVGNGAWPYPDDCGKYVVCWELDQPMLGQCTDNMLFDLVYHGCNYAQYVDCGTRPRPTDVPSTLHPPSSTLPTTTSNVSTTTTERPSEQFDCPGEGVYPHEEHCEYYWSCYAGVADLIHCQLDYLFDLEYMGCNFPQYTVCGDRVRPPGSGEDPSTGPTKLTTVTTTVTTTVASTGETPEPEPTVSEWTTEGTGPTTTPDPNVTTTTKATTVGGGTFECPTPEGNFPDPQDCTAYYQCAEDIPYHQYCPDGLYYNPVVGVCDFPENVVCEIK